VTLKTFSAMIGDHNRPVTREYEDIVEKVYAADYMPVNFQNVDQTLNEVNKWASDNTDGQIRDILTREDLLKVRFDQLYNLTYKKNYFLRHNLYCYRE
jgi:serine protease inhibitor